MTRKQPFNIYIASCDPEGGVYQYSVTENNQVELVSKASCDRPMYLAREGNRMYVLLREPFAHSEESGLMTYEIDEKGELNALDSILTTHGKCACYLSVRNEEVFVANYLSGNLVKMSNQVVQHSGLGAHPTRQEGPHTHFIDFRVNSNVLLAADLGTDYIYSYDTDLVELSRTYLPSGSGARHMACQGEYVYCVGELASTVSVFYVDHDELIYRNSYSTLPDEFAGENTAAAIRIQDDFLYVSNRGHDSIAVYRIKNDKLYRICIVPCGGKSPRDFNIFNNLLICTNEASDNVTFFELQNGVPTQLSVELEVKSPLCVI